MKSKISVPVVLSFLLGLVIVGYYLLRVKRLPSESEVVTAAGFLLIGFGKLYELVNAFLAKLKPATGTPPAPPAALVGALLFVFLAIPACATTGSALAGVENAVVDCTKGVQATVLPAVQGALASADYNTKIGDIANALEAKAKAAGSVTAARDALCVVGKAVAWIVNELDELQGAAPATEADPVGVLTLKNGRAWLHANLPSGPEGAPAMLRRRLLLPRRYACR